MRPDVGTIARRNVADVLDTWLYGQKSIKVQLKEDHPWNEQLAADIELAEKVVLMLEGGVIW